MIKISEWHQAIWCLAGLLPSFRRFLEDMVLNYIYMHMCVYINLGVLDTNSETGPADASLSA